MSQGVGVGCDELQAASAARSEKRAAKPHGHTQTAQHPTSEPRSSLRSLEKASVQVRDRPLAAPRARLRRPETKIAGLHDGALRRSVGQEEDQIWLKPLVPI